MLLSFFVFGSIWFWAIMAIEIILLFAFVEQECFGYSFVSLAIFLGILCLFGNFNVFSYITENPIECLKYLGYYLVLGVVWSYAKFTLVGSKLKRKIDLMRLEYLKNVNTKVTTDEDWQRHLRSNLDWKDKKSLEISNFAKRVIGWMAYWPISLLATVFKDILIDFYEFIYHTFLINSFTRLHNYFFKDVYKLKVNENGNGTN